MQTITQASKPVSARPSFQIGIWSTLTSVRLTIVLLVSLSLFCVLGTLVAQQGQTQVPIEKLYDLSTLRILNALGLIDVFHSPYFVLNMFLLALNLLACSVERLPPIWKNTFFVAPSILTNGLLYEIDPAVARKNKYLIHRFSDTSFSESEAKLLVKLFCEKQKMKYKVLQDRTENKSFAFQFFFEKGRYSRLGVYITHISLLMIMFGAVVGALKGFEGAMSIEEGTRQSWIQHLKGNNLGMPLMKENGIPIESLLNLGFEVECEDFTLETYDGERPKLFKSKLNFYENDVLVDSTEISVNHPFVFKGLTFYQASFNEIGIGGIDLKLFRLEKGQTDVELVEKVKLNETYRIDGDAGFRIVAVEKNMMELGPAAKVEFFRNKKTKKPESFWIFQNLPGFDFAHRKGSKFHFALDKMNPKYATGLSVARDPGVGVVWIGSLILVLALFLALYTFHSRVWICYESGRGFVLAGWTNKVFLFENKFKKIIEEFENELKSQQSV
ncbi:MAG: cytochrome c biogenesis protein ResB [Bacteriovoracia bacterium]